MAWQLIFVAAGMAAQYGAAARSAKYMRRAAMLERARNRVKTGAARKNIYAGVDVAQGQQVAATLGSGEVTEASGLYGAQASTLAQMREQMKTSQQLLELGGGIEDATFKAAKYEGQAQLYGSFANLMSGSFGGMVNDLFKR